MMLWRRRVRLRTPVTHGVVGFQVDQLGDGVGRGVCSQGGGAAIAGTGRDRIPHSHLGSERLVINTKFGTF